MALYAGTKEEAKNHAVPVKSNPNPNLCHIFPKFCVFCFNFYLSYNSSTLCHQRGRLIVMDEYNFDNSIRKYSKLNEYQ